MFPSIAQLLPKFFPTKGKKSSIFQDLSVNFPSLFQLVRIMSFILKQDIIKAFQQNKMKRNNLLFEYYKDTLFFKGLTAEFIADKISQDLGLEISPSIIYKINHRIIKNGVQSPDKQTASPLDPAPSAAQKQNLQGKKSAEPLPSSSSFKFKNADEYPQKDPLEGAFKDL